MSSLRHMRLLCAPFAALGLILPTPSAYAAAALAVASTENSVAYYWDGNRSSVAEAEQRALSLCRESAYERRHATPCRIGLSAEGPAYWAVVTAHNGGIGFGQDEIDWVAVSKARDNCAPLGLCATEASVTWYDRVPKAYQILEPYPRQHRRHAREDTLPPRNPAAPTLPANPASPLR